MEEWMEKYFGKKEPKTRKSKDSPWMWPAYLAICALLATLKGCI